MPVTGSAVLIENGRRSTRPDRSPVRDMDELPGSRPVGERRRVEGLEPLARQNLPAVDEFRRDQPHAHPSAASPSARRALGLVRRRPRGRPGRPLGSASSLGLGRRHSVGLLAGHRREGLGERLGEVAEDVRRIVELDELLRRRRASSTRRSASSGTTSARKLPLASRVSRSSSSSTMIRSPSLRGQPRCLRLERLDELRLGLLAALLVGQREVVERAGGLFLVVRFRASRPAAHASAAAAYGSSPSRPSRRARCRPRPSGRRPPWARRAGPRRCGPPRRTPGRRRPGCRAPRAPPRSR